MVRIMPEELQPKVEEPSPKKQPVSRARLLRAMENIDRAQTRTEQEQLAATVTEYSKKAITPSLIDSLEVRREAVPSLAATSPVAGGEARVPLSSVAPHRTGEGRRLPEPEPVFRSDEEFESAKASLDLKGISDVQVFGEVPKSYWEKQKGVKTERRPLMETPKKYEDESGMKGIQVIGKVPEGYLKARRAEFVRVVPEVGKNLSLIAPEVWRGPTADFAIDRTKAELAEESELMGEAGPEFLGEMQIKPGVNVSELRPEMKEGFEMVKGLYNAVGVDTKDILLTDAKTKRRTHTFHDVGFGADFGWKTLNKDQQEGIIERLNSLAEIKHPLKNGGRFWRIGDYDVLVHKIKGNEWHFHLEYEKGKPELEEYWKDYKSKKSRGLPYAEEV